MPVAFESDVPDFHLRALAYHERHIDAGRRQLSDFRPDCGELVAVLRFQLADDNFCMLHLGVIKLRFGRKPHLFLLESVENVALRDRVDTNVINLFNTRFFLDVDVDHPTFGGGLALETDVLEKTCIPQGIEVTLDGSLIVNVARVSEDMGKNDVFWDAAVPMDFDCSNYVLLGNEVWRTCDKEKSAGREANLPKESGSLAE